MKWFILAAEIDDPELKYLNYYKILEHFVAVNMEANEQMVKKLDVPKKKINYGSYISEIFELAISFQFKMRDEELIKSTFYTCFNFIEHYNLLPEPIKKEIRDLIKESDLSYHTSKQNQTSAANKVGKILYATRNMVVHAKSNYQKTGDECSNKNLP